MKYHASYSVSYTNKGSHESANASKTFQSLQDAFEFIDLGTFEIINDLLITDVSLSTHIYPINNKTNAPSTTQKFFDR